MEGSRLVAPLTAAKLDPAAPSHEIQQLWFALRRKEWSSLAVIAVEPNTSARFIAEGLAAVGELHRGVPVKLVNGEGATVAASSRLAVALSTHVAAGAMAIAVLDSVVENQAGIPVALTADAILLAVSLRRSKRSSLERTLELLGKDRVLGTVAIRPHGT